MIIGCEASAALADPEENHPSDSNSSRKLAENQSKSTPDSTDKEKDPDATKLFASTEANSLYMVDREFAANVFDTVDENVRNEFFDVTTATKLWPQIAAKSRGTILDSKTIEELSQRINAALAQLNASHTQFVTVNDEHYYFLRSLFDSFKPEAERKKTPQAEFIGAGLGGPLCQANQVRYVLNNSPAVAAGLKRGDILLKVDDRPFLGMLSFTGTAGNTTKILIQRGSKTLELTIKPVKQKYYDAFLDLTRKSARIIPTAEGPVGYIHLWCGGSAGEILSEEVTENLSQTKGMIVDLRDGYGGNSLQDLDVFYRPVSGYPEFRTFGRKDKQVTRFTYSGPLVTLINGGSRSGKELLAFSLKNSKRGALVGERTAGAVLAGRMIVINDRCALYLAVMDGTIGGKRLEGIGVPPDINVAYPLSSNEDVQLESALKTINSLLKRRTEINSTKPGNHPAAKRSSTTHRS